MASPVNPPRGMRDFLPAEKAKRETLLGVIRDTYRAHGFDEIETPVMEESDRLHAGLGGDNEKLAFGVLKRGLTAEHIAAAESALDLADLGLRFDLTVPLARFYASHQAELPSVFRAIQIAPVWRAERPQKGRYRQFVQCDIDIIGESGVLAEVELISATAATLSALGIEGCSIRINDRRLLSSMLTVFGFAADDHPNVLITVDKLDKLGSEGVVAELRERGYATDAVDRFESFLHRPQTLEMLPFGDDAIRRALPDGIDDAAVEQLAALAAAVDAETLAMLQFDPFLVRGMGYYTGTIFEVVHPSLGYSLAGGGRYDGMIGRFLGRNVPAVGFSIGFERLVDLIDLPAKDAADAVALVYDTAMTATELIPLKVALLATGKRVRLEKRTRNLGPLLEQLKGAGFTRYASVTSASTPDTLEYRDLR
ncbi:MAG: histidine--tRNA ligase [Microbacteriaceae bacterium]